MNEDQTPSVPPVNPQPSDPIAAPTVPTTSEASIEAQPLPPAKSHKSWLVGVAVLAALVLMGVGYAYFAPLTPERLLQRMAAASVNVKTVGFDGAMAMDMTMGSAADSSGLAFGTLDADTGERTIKLNFNASGHIDASDPENAAIDSVMKLSGEGIVVSFDARVISQELYLRLTEAPFLGFIDPGAIKNKWIKFDKAALEESGTETSFEFTPEQKEQANQAFMDNQPISLGNRLADEEINGVRTLHYQVIVDKEKLKQYLAKLSEIRGTEYDAASIEESFSKIEIKDAEVWIGAKDYLLYRMKFAVDVVDVDADSSGRMSFDVSLKDYNHPVSVEMPTGARSFKEIFQELFQFPTEPTSISG